MAWYVGEAAPLCPAAAFACLSRWTGAGVCLSELSPDLLACLLRAALGSGAAAAPPEAADDGEGEPHDDEEARAAAAELLSDLIAAVDPLPNRRGEHVIKQVSS